MGTVQPFGSSEQKIYEAFKAGSIDRLPGDVSGVVMGARARLAMSAVSVRCKAFFSNIATWFSRFSTGVKIKWAEHKLEKLGQGHLTGSQGAQRTKLRGRVAQLKGRYNELTKKLINTAVNAFKESAYLMACRQLIPSSDGDWSPAPGDMRAYASMRECIIRNRETRETVVMEAKTEAVATGVFARMGAWARGGDARARAAVSGVAVRVRSAVISELEGSPDIYNAAVAMINTAADDKMAALVARYPTWENRPS